MTSEPASVSELAGPQPRVAPIDMGQVRDELLAWMKTLISAAVYAGSTGNLNIGLVIAAAPLGALLLVLPTPGAGA